MSEQVVMPEYKTLVGSSTDGDSLLANQGAAENFSRVSQYWIPQTLSFDQCLEQLAKERSNCVDIVGKWSDWDFVVEQNQVALKNNDGRVFIPSKFALQQATDWAEVKRTHINHTLYSEFEFDETDLAQLVDMLNYRKQRNHQTDKNETRDLLFRTYSDNSLRAVLTKGYGIINNEWLVGVLKDLLPSGRVSHMRGNLDTIYMNILIPDSIRHEEDSDYGGMYAIRNSEIGQASLDCLPSLFRFICRNSNIWGETKGSNLRQVHRGKIELDVLAVKIGECLDKQIKLIPEIMENFLKLRQYEFTDVALTGIFAVLKERYKMTTKQAGDVMSQFAEHEKHSRTAFSVINSVTRASQLYNPEECEHFDMIGGNLISEDWDKIVSKAKAYSENEIADILGLTA